MTSGAAEYSRALANGIRIASVLMTSTARAAHIGSNLSIADIMAVLYSGTAHIDPSNPGKPERDRVVVSKGHAAAAVYSCLALRGFMPLTALMNYHLDGSPLTGHVTRGGVPGVEFSTGSLGHGLPYSVGLSIAAQRARSEVRVFCLMSDGECDEGSVWEAALLAAHHMLRHLTVIIDRNRLQSLADTEDTVALEPLMDKWTAFGWDVLEVDGHDHSALRNAFTQTPESKKPRCVIARTIKGKGVSFMEAKVAWHYQSLDREQLTAAIGELDAAAIENPWDYLARRFA